MTVFKAILLAKEKCGAGDVPDADVLWVSAMDEAAIGAAA